MRITTSHVHAFWALSQLLPIAAVPFSHTIRQNGIEDGGSDPVRFVHFEWKDGCTEQQKTTVIHSWQDAVLLASAAWNSGIDAKTNWAATDFFGPPVYSEKWRDRTLAVYKEIGLTSATFSNPSHHPNTLNINVYCNLSSDEQRGPEWSHTCSLRDEEGKKVPVGIKKPGEPTYQVNWLIGAFTWNTENQDGSGQKQKTSQFFGNMQLCPRFWAVYTKSLQDVIEDHAYSGRRKVKFNLDNYGNKGTIMLHEAMHIANLTRRANGDRYIDDLMMDYVQYHKRMDGGVDGVPMTGTAYGPLLCKVLARTVKAGIGDLITQNADNFAWFATAQFLTPILGHYPWLFPADGQADNIRNGASGLLQVVDGKLGINSDIEGVPEAIAASINHQISTEEAKRVNLAEGITSLDEYPPEYVAWIREQALKLNGPDVAPSCAHAPGTPPPSILPFNDAAATEAAKKLCENKSYWDKMIVPQIAFGTGRSPDGTGKALGVSESVLIGDTEVVAGLYFMEGDCIGEFKFPPGPGDEQSRLSACINAFAAITDECDHDTKDQKYGGSLQDACAVYRVGAAPKGTNPFPLTKDLGPVKCADTRTPQGAPPANSCTCWYEKLAGNTAIFPKPKDGCESIKTRPAYTIYEDPDPAHMGGGPPAATLTAVPTP